MYVPPFVCGIFFTIIVGVVALIIGAIVYGKRRSKRRK